MPRRRGPPARRLNASEPSARQVGRGLRHPLPVLKPRQQISGGDMAIIAIAVFLIVMAALNRFEFGRFD
jgi:hypothetical protein